MLTLATGEYLIFSNRGDEDTQTITIYNYSCVILLQGFPKWAQKVWSRDFASFLLFVSCAKYPRIAIQVLIICQATYLCEKTFSFYASAKTKCRKRWNVENVIRLQITSIMPVFEKVYHRTAALKSLTSYFGNSNC